ncbi:hypothetical protein ACFQX4_10745 [Roseomonas sp. GCM10028921]
MSAGLPDHETPMLWGVVQRVILPGLALGLAATLGVATWTAVQPALESRVLRQQEASGEAPAERTAAVPPAAVLAEPPPLPAAAPAAALPEEAPTSGDDVDSLLRKAAELDVELDRLEAQLRASARQRAEQEAREGPSAEDLPLITALPLPPPAPPEIAGPDGPLAALPMPPPAPPGDAVPTGTLAALLRPPSAPPMGEVLAGPSASLPLPPPAPPEGVAFPGILAALPLPPPAPPAVAMPVAPQVPGNETLAALAPASRAAVPVPPPAQRASAQAAREAQEAGPARGSPNIRQAAAAAVAQRRCQVITLRIQLGEEPSRADQRFLRDGCR